MAEQRYEAVRAVIADGETVKDVAARFGVSRKTVHVWLARYEVGGLQGLAERSHRPRACPHQMPLAHLNDALIVHLDPWHETHGVSRDKARRYQWPSEASLVPQVTTVRDSRHADLGNSDVRLLTVALRGVLAQDERRLAPVGESAGVIGEIVFPDGTIARYEVARPELRATKR